MNHEAQVEHELKAIKSILLAILKALRPTSQGVQVEKPAGTVSERHNPPVQASPLPPKPVPMPPKDLADEHHEAAFRPPYKPKWTPPEG